MADEITPLEQKAKEIIQAREGQNLSEEMGNLSLIEEARALKEENLKISREIKENLDRFEKMTAQAMLAGKSFSIKEPEKTDKERAEEEARKLISRFR